jgi:hypothetical protein
MLNPYPQPYPAWNANPANDPLEQVSTPGFRQAVLAINMLTSYIVRTDADSAVPDANRETGGRTRGPTHAFGKATGKVIAGGEGGKRAAQDTTRQGPRDD